MLCSDKEHKENHHYDENIQNKLKSAMTYNVQAESINTTRNCFHPNEYFTNSTK